MSESSAYEPWRPTIGLIENNRVMCMPGTFLVPALDIRSESLYELAPEIQNVMGLRALKPDAAVVKVMSVRNNRCIRVVTPEDYVTCGYHEILLHDMGDEELPFVSLS